MTSTIYALSTAPGQSGVAVFRVSGPQSGAILDALTGRTRPDPRHAVLRRLTAKDGRAIDTGLVLWFPGPKSFTGEDSAEFHIHGGMAVVEAMSDALLGAGAKPAQAGEFTRRAFENDKIDLTEAEGLADLIASETEAQRAQALAQMDGSLRRLYESWRESLIGILTRIEGEIDFPDEDDVPGALAQTAGLDVKNLIAELTAHLDDGRRGEIIRKGFVAAIIGEPNVGKSSILNRLTKSDAAIVTDIPGTTRDIVNVRLVIGGFPVTVSDTAGLRDSTDRVEQEGIRRAKVRAKDADLRIGVVDAGTAQGAAALGLQAGDLLVVNKSDLSRATPPEDAILVSAKTGAGFDEFEERLRAIVSERLSARESPTLSRARHRDAVETARSALERGLNRLADAPELAGEDVRLAVRALESITGRIDVEDVLDRVFSQFCIGK